jgi:4-aminobutyrate aminotransferase-like enzyme
MINYTISKYLGGFMPTVAEGLYQDERVAQAKQLLKEALAEHSGKITEVKPGNKDLKKSYEKLLEKFGKDRGGKLFYDYIGSGIGNGPFVELADGSVKYDFITGIGVHYFGHSHPGVMDSLVDAALGNTIMHGNLQQNVDSADLVALILSQANKNKAGFDHCLLTSSGAMSLENALKIAFQKRFPCKRVFVFEKCFMGRTLTLAQTTDKAGNRQGLPKTVDVDYIPFYDANDHQGSIDRAVAKMKHDIKRYPCDHAVFSMELIQGEAGYWPGHTDFFMALIDICKEHGISVLVDEVQTFMRTPELFATQFFKLDKHVDIITIGKNSQVCATIYRKDHAPKPGLLSQTFTSSTAAIKAGYFIINEVANNGYLGEDGKIMRIHNYFTGKLEELDKKHPDLISGPHGIGAMIGMTLYGGDLEKSKNFTIKLFQNGVLSFIAGSNPTRVRFLVPMGAIEEHHIDGAIEIIEKTLLECK